jgi:uncharacterized membrane protein
MFRNIIIFVVLILSGILQLMDPYSLVNYLPAFLPSKLDLIFVNGILNFILAVSLFIPRFKKISLILVIGDFLVIILIALTNFIR